MEPFVFKTKFNKITGQVGRLSFAATGVTSPDTGENFGIAVIEIIVVSEEVIDDELLFLDMGRCPCSPASHLLVENGATYATAHYEMKHLAAVETSI